MELKNLLDVVIPSSCGMVVFPIVLGLMQHLWKNLSVTAHRCVASSCGFISFLTATVLSAAFYLFTEELIVENSHGHGFRGKDGDWEAVLYFVSCLLIFKLFGGHFKSLCPSNILHPGAFAIESVPIQSAEAHVTKPKKRRIQEIGAKYGCHTCGLKYDTSTDLVYDADHIPPSKLQHKFPKDKKKLLPQCRTCCYHQAIIVREYLENPKQCPSRPVIITHAKRWKIHKLWIPFPALFRLGALSLLSGFLEHHQL